MVEGGTKICVFGWVGKEASHPAAWGLNLTTTEFFLWGFSAQRSEESIAW